LIGTSFDLEKKFLAGIVVIILAGIRSSHRHDDEGAVLEQQLVANRRLQQVAVLLDPALQVERGNGRHGCIIPALNFIAFAAVKSGLEAKCELCG
jgi:hypothetical protein